MLRFRVNLLIASGLATALAYGQSNYDPSIVLVRARDRVVDLSERLPKYTCIQTVNRTYFGTDAKPESRVSCDQLAGDNMRRKRKLHVEATDRLRLEVIVTAGHEVYAWAGASRFDSPYADFVGGGPIGTGPFGTFLIDIFRNDGVSFAFQDTTQLDGKTVLEYAYQVPLEASHYFTRSLDERWLATSFSGLLWVNPATNELERLTVRTSELPAETGACTADTRADYQTVHLGTGAFLLPLESELHFVLRNGEETDSVAAYSKCREYTAESNLSFEAPSTPANPPDSPAPDSLSIPEGLHVTLSLLSPVDTQTTAAGDSISAQVKNPVVSPKSKAVVISAGAVVRGRIVRMEHRFLPSPHFLISIAWTELVDHDAVAPFSARIEQIDPAQVKTQAEFQNRRITVWLPPPGESKRASGWFILPTTKDRYVVPAGYKTQWLTSLPSERN